MAKKNYRTDGEGKAALGQLIIQMRKEKNLSLRKFAEAISLSPSNLSYIENGVNVPTAEIYQKMLNILKPDAKQQIELDELYTAIRKVPPPDICDILLRNPTLAEKVRLLANVQLSSRQLGEVEKLFTTFTTNEDNT